VNPIRPNLPPALSPNAAPKPADAARLAAQKAFFEVALGKAAPAPAPAAPAAAPVQDAPARAAAPLKGVDTPAEAASRPLRPGSLLDIRV
jgi:hypothetical protein